MVEVRTAHWKTSAYKAFMAIFTPTWEYYIKTLIKEIPLEIYTKCYSGESKTVKWARNVDEMEEVLNSYAILVYKI
jgi:hypothetical protein